MISILVAYDADRAIGKDGKIPWHLSEDLKAFKARTMGHAVIMGRRTWESLPKKPLPKRTNIILSHRLDYDVGVEVGDPVFCLSDPALAMDLAHEATKGKEVFIIGGANVYATYLAMGWVDRIIATVLPGSYKGDVFFPKLNQENWNFGKLIEEHDGYSVLEYTKRHTLGFCDSSTWTANVPLEGDLGSVPL